MTCAAFKYTDRATPAGYACKCGRHGVRLWRAYQTFRPRLLCVECALSDQSVDPDALRSSDQIGWFVPAVPLEEGGGFWGYASVPDEAVAWWYALPCDRPVRRDFWEVAP